MSEELTAEEQERLRKVAVVGKVSLGIVLKWLWLFALLFAVLFAGLTWRVVQRAAQSPQRYSAETRLMYMPHGEGKVPGMGDKQLYRILERRSLKKKTGENEGLPLPPGEKSRLATDLEIRQDARPSNVYTLKAMSGSREAAVRKVNAYADVLIAEYGERRMMEISRWGGAAEVRKAAMRTELGEVERELADIKTRVGTDAPVETLASLMSMLGEERRNLMLLDVEIATTEKVRKTLESGQDDETTAAILAKGPELRKLRNGIEALDSEIAKLRQVYTDLNPRVLGKLEDRNELEKKYRAIVEECGGVDPGDGGMEAMARTQTSLLDATSRLDALHEQRGLLQDTLERNEVRARQLQAVAPQAAVLAARKLELERSLVDLEEQLGSLGDLQEGARKDLIQIERAADAAEQSPFRRENLLLAAVLAGLGTGGLALLTVLLGLYFGRIRGAGELAAHGDILVLGSLPRRWFLRRKLAQEAMGVVANHFVQAEVPTGIVLVCRLRGAKPQPEFVSTLDWALSMAGRKPFILTMVPQEGGDIPQEDTESMLNTVRKGPRGWFPVVNRYSLASTELQMLKADLESLRQEFDCVFVSVHDGLRHGGDFTAQLLEVCETALLVVGANQTRRTELGYARRLAKEAGKPMLGLVTGVRAGIVRKELEESRW